MEGPNIALIGFRATGKSHIGKLLAQRLGRVFVDMDEQLVASFGRTIDCWVHTHGWESFRNAEAKLLSELGGQKGLVVATGGGIILGDLNRETLRRYFQVVWLKASPGTIHSRLVQDPKTAAQRPPLTALSLKEEIEQVLAERTPLYESAADFVVDTDSQTAEEIVSRIEEYLIGKA